MSTLRLRLSPQQTAAWAAATGGLAAEARSGYRVPLRPAGPSEQHAALSWLHGFSLDSAGGVQLAYAAEGSSGLLPWRSASGSAVAAAGAPACDSGGVQGRQLCLNLGTITVAAAARGVVPGCPPTVVQDLAVLQMQLLQAQVCLLPELTVRLPAAEIRLGAALASDPAAAVLQPEPVLLLAGAGYERRQQGGQQHTSVRLGSLSLAVSPADYVLLLRLLCCWRQQPMLPPGPALLPASEQLQTCTNSAALVAAEDCSDDESTLVVQLDAATICLWPQQQDAQRQHRQPHGLTLWLRQLQLRKQQVGGGSSSTQVVLAAAHAALMRRSPGGHLPSSGADDVPALQFSSVLRLPASMSQHSQQQQQQQEAPALTYLLSRTPSRAAEGVGSGTFSPVRKGQGSLGGARLQLQAAPLGLTVSSELAALVGGIASDWSSSRGSDGCVAVEVPAAVGDAAPEPLQGKCALGGLQALLVLEASWELPGGSPQERQGQLLLRQRPGAQGAAAVEVAVEEAVVLLQQAAAAENRPWLARCGEGAAAGGSLTTADASLIGAAVTVWHSGANRRSHAVRLAAHVIRCFFLCLDSGCTCALPPCCLQALLVLTPQRCCRPPTLACSCCTSRTMAPRRWQPTRSSYRCRSRCPRWPPSLPSPRF